MSLHIGHPGKSAGATGEGVTVAGNEVDMTLLRQAVRYLVEQGAPIKLIAEAEVLAFEIEGRSVTASQVVLKAYAAGMADVV